MWMLSTIAMIKEKNIISVKEVLSRLLKHPLLQDVNIEQAVQYTIDFIGIFGLPNFYEVKCIKLPIDNYRALLPDDLVSIDFVSNNGNYLNIVSQGTNDYGYKTQGRVLYTSFKSGEIDLTYKSIPVDDHGFPYLIDNPVFLKALEAYIKKEAFTILFDMGKIQPQVLQHAEQQYAWLAGQLQAEFSIPSVTEMEKLKNMWCSLIQRNNEFSKGFKTLGAVENFKVH